MKISRREAYTFLLGGLAALGGITADSEKSSLPKKCKRPVPPKLVDPRLMRWELFPYSFEFGPISKEELAQGLSPDSFPLIPKEVLRGGE